ncbi:hypothetical protein F5Y17DRAFT_410687 [Xylariaceae sp. FL0594]|nr:hypothetical protein F5Y17DRAFT_410687 [Xylariaceae sp. FL0594]
MPIGDLLAEITGGKSSPAPAPKPTASLGVKRKAEDGSDSATSTKLAKSRQPDGSYPTSKATRGEQPRAVERPHPVPRPARPQAPSNGSAIRPMSLPHRTEPPATNGRPDPLPSNGQRMISSAPQQKRTSETQARPKSNQPTSTAPKAVPPRLLSATSSTAAPKRGSFKEILARAAKAQETMGKVGMIQHKPIDKNAVKKEVAKPDQKPGLASSGKGKAGTPYTGSSRPGAAPGRDLGHSGTPTRDIPKNGHTKSAGVAGKSRAGSLPVDGGEKKVKKSATATTGYTGTARPRPDGSSLDKRRSRPEQHPRHGGLLEPPRLNRRSREDEYDDDMDDFIDYDEEEEEEERRRYYDSDGSSDMEAGLSDIDSEERRAERAAREEDRREQLLEEKLKREKEERKRRLATGR